MSRSAPRHIPEPDFRALFESAPGLYLVLTPDLTIVAVSEAYLGATMTRREAILGRGLFEVFPDNPDDPAATGVANLKASLGRVLAHRQPDAMAVQKYDIRRPESEGGGFEERHWSPVNSPVLDAEGRVTYIIHRVEDVTEFLRLKQHGSEQERLTAELQSRAVRMEAEIYHRAQEIQEANRELRRLKDELEDRVRERTADLERTLEALRHSEDQLRQAQKLEAVGLLAGGIAHDFNNLLTAMLGYASMVRARLKPGDPSLRDVDEVLGAAERAARLTRQLLAFSRQQVLEPKVLDLNTVITDLGRMLRRLIGEDIDLVTAPAPELGRVKADPGQLEQVLMNLAVNARDAMPDGGKLTIETANVDLDEGYGREGADVRPGRYVMLAVSDTGCGMSASVRARMFEPFFTTKERGHGTGLGLSTVHGIVKQSDGHIEVYSEPGHGTTFKIYLPQVEGPLGALDAPDPAVPGAGRLEGSETILLVEDEEVIRRVLRTSLEMHGYTVIEAGDGSEAIASCERRDQPLDLLVTDVIMPLMNGPDLAHRVAAIRPDLPVLFMSGYTDRALIHQGLRRSGTAFIQKPFTPEALARKIRELLDEPRSQAA